MPADRAPKQKKCVCPCGTAVSSSSSLSRHKRTHVIYSKRKYGCPYEGCGYRCSQSNGLKSHVERKHKKTSFNLPNAQGSDMDLKFVEMAAGDADYRGIGCSPVQLPSAAPKPYPSNLLEQFETFAFQSSSAIEAPSEQAFDASWSALGCPPIDHPTQYIDFGHAFEVNSSAMPIPNYATLGGINYPADVRIGCPSRGDENNQVLHQLADNANISEATWTASDPFTLPDPYYLGSNVQRWTHHDWQAQSEASLRSLPFYPSSSHLLFSDPADFVLPNVSDIPGFIL